MGSHIDVADSAVAVVAVAVAVEFSALGRWCELLLLLGIVVVVVVVVVVAGSAETCGSYSCCCRGSPPGFFGPSFGFLLFGLEPGELGVVGTVVGIVIVPAGLGVAGHQAW